MAISWALKTIPVMIIALMFLLSGCGSEDSDNSSAMPQPMNPSKSITGATVNGERITSQDVSQASQSVAKQGVEMSGKEVLERLINQELLSQAAEDYKPSDGEAKALLESQLALQNSSLEDYKQKLEGMGYSLNDELENIREQMAVRSFINSKINVSVTEGEMKQFYEKFQQQSEKEVPPFEEIRQRINSTMREQKKDQAVQALIQKLRQDAEIKYE